MTPEEYAAKAIRTASPAALVNQKDGMLHWYLGMVGECHELMTQEQDGNVHPAEREAELGDLFWYLAQFAHEWEWKLGGLLGYRNALIDRERVLPQILEHLAGMGEALKKYRFYENATVEQTEKWRKSILYHLLRAVFYAQHWAAVNGHSLSDVFKANIAKLEARYPGGFDK